VASRYAASEVGKYLAARFGFTFLELPFMQPLEDLIWETAREAQLHRRELAAVCGAMAGDLAYVQQSLSGEGSRSVYEPLDRVPVHQRAQDVNHLERRVQSLLNAHAGMVRAWDEHGKRDAEDHAIYTQQAGELRELKTLAEHREHVIGNLEEARTSILAELEMKERELAGERKRAEDYKEELRQALVDVQEERGGRADAEASLRASVDEYHEVHEELEGLKQDRESWAERLRAAELAEQGQQNRAEEADERVRELERQVERLGGVTTG
jgi:chromosome segregation ATPase